MKTEWIDINDTTESPGYCLCLGIHNDYHIGYLDTYTGECEDESSILPDVTHWMPLPEPPAKAGE